jgi:biopolymer transport protein ExbD
MISIKPKKDYLVALESVAMTDIVLNMFIFFFISFSILYTFSPEKISKIQVKLPRAETAIALEGSEKAILVINKRGEYFMDNVRIKGADLKNALAERLKENPSLGVILKVDSMAKFESVVKAIDTINALNIQKISIAAVKNSGKEQL